MRSRAKRTKAEEDWGINSRRNTVVTSSVPATWLYTVVINYKTLAL